MARALEITLTDTERGELERRARRRKIARGDAMRAQIVLLAASGYGNSAIARFVGAARKTVQSWRGRFVRDRLDGLSDEPRAALGELALHPPDWQPRRESRPRRCIGSGERSHCSHIGSRPSSFRPTRSSWKRCAISLASISIRRSVRLSYASMKRARFKHLTALNRFSRCAPVRSSGGPTIMNGTGPPPYLPHS